MSNPNIFRFNREIYPYTLYKIFNQLNKLVYLFFLCFSTYYTFNSLSYTYELLYICTNNIYIFINMIYSYWYFDQAFTIANIDLPPIILVLDLFLVHFRNCSKGVLNWRSYKNIIVERVLREVEDKGDRVVLGKIRV